MALTDDLLARFEAQQATANEANEKRYDQAMAIYDEIIAQYQPGGAFGQSVEAGLQREKTRTVAKQTQDLTSSGLFGTSLTAGLGSKFEEEVGQPTRLRAQDISFERLASASQGKASFIERREDTGPDYATIASLAQTAGQGGGGDDYTTSRRASNAMPGGTGSSTNYAREAYDRATAGFGGSSGGQEQNYRRTTGGKRVYGGSVTNFVNKQPDALKLDDGSWVSGWSDKPVANTEGPTNAAAVDSNIDTTVSYGQAFEGPPIGGDASRAGSTTNNFLADVNTKYGQNKAGYTNYF